MSVVENKASRARYEGYLEMELEAAAMYSALADIETDPHRADVFRKLVVAEMRHAGRWAELLGIDPAGLKPGPLGTQSRLLRLGARLFGTGRVLPILIRSEAKGLEVYAADPEARDLVPEEREHWRALSGLSHPEKTGEPAPEGGALGRSGKLRAAVLGVNDGLVSNFSLVMGVAGGTGNPDFILLAGVAGLLAGAFSMAAGEYISMRSQRDVHEYELQKEAMEIRYWPEEELEELELIYQAKGMTREEASRIAHQVMSDPQVALRTMAREELGLDPSELGAPWGAASSSFFAFVFGAFVPIIPYLLEAGDSAMWISSLLSAGALFAVGGLVAVMSGRNIWLGGLRMLLVGGVAAAVTYGVGSLIEVSVSEIR